MKYLKVTFHSHPSYYHKKYKKRLKTNTIHIENHIKSFINVFYENLMGIHKDFTCRFKIVKISLGIIKSQVEFEIPNCYKNYYIFRILEESRATYNPLTYIDSSIYMEESKDDSFQLYSTLRDDLKV